MDLLISLQPAMEVSAAEQCLRYGEIFDSLRQDAARPHLSSCHLFPLLQKPLVSREACIWRAPLDSVPSVLYATKTCCIARCDYACNNCSLKSYYVAHVAPMNHVLAERVHVNDLEWCAAFFCKCSIMPTAN